MSNKVLGRLVERTNHVLSMEATEFYRNVDDRALGYAIESCCRDLNITLTLMASMESLKAEADGYEGFISLESYERRLDNLLESVGIYTPITTLVPSFEAVKEESDTVTGKIKKVGKAFWEVILRTFKRLKEFFMRLIGKSKEKEKTLKEKTEGFVSDLKSQGITHITNPKPTGNLIKTHAYSPSAIPGIFLDNKIWSKVKIESIARDVNAALDKVEKGTPEELRAAKTEFEKKYNFRHDGDEKQWTASISDLEDAVSTCSKLLKRIYGIFGPIGEELDSMIEKAEKMQKEGGGGEDANKLNATIERYKTAFELHDALRRVDSISWVAIGVVSHAKVG